MRKLALFVGGMSAEFPVRTTEYIAQSAKEKGFALEVFVNFGSFGGNSFHGFGEKNIIHIPSLGEYDGIILASDTFGVEGMYEELTARIESCCSCPVVSLRKRDERFYNVLVDNYTNMSKMVEHFIRVHGFTRICFMTGVMTMEDAKERLRAYRETMARYGLPVTEDMIFEGDYWKQKGAQAVSYFLDREGERPQVIVCSNDYMAVSVCEALRERGIRVPEEICVSGFDDVEEARFSVPSITSTHVSCQEMASLAVGMIENILEHREQARDEYVRPQGRLRESCGCSKIRDVGEAQQLFTQKEYMDHVLLHSLYMNIDMEEAGSFESLIQTAHDYAPELRYEELYICLCDSRQEQELTGREMGEYTENMVLSVIMRPQEVQFCQERFPRREILPEHCRRDGKFLYVTCLHAKNRCVGYAVIKTRHIERLMYFYQIWLMGVAGSLERLRMSSENQSLLELRSQYGQDQLTGLATRREMEKILKKSYERLELTGMGFCIASIDMDGLKTINDSYGHLEGDAALCAMAEILKEARGTLGEAARVGGDEFLLCIASEDPQEVEGCLDLIREGIRRYNGSGAKPYSLSASIGYAFCQKGDNLVGIQELADQNMYREKRTKKQARRGGI